MERELSTNIDAKSSGELSDTRSVNPKKDGGGLASPKLDDPGTTQNQDSHDLRQIIQESKEKLAEEAQAPKKSRGRPRKTGSVDGGGATGPKPGDPQLAATPAPSYAPILSTAIELPFRAWAKNTKCPGLALEADESKALGEQTDLCLRTYFPQLSEKASILVTTIASFGIVILGKYTLLQEHREKNAPKQQEHENVQFVPEPQHQKFEEGPPISTDQFFPQTTQ